MRSARQKRELIGLKFISKKLKKKFLHFLNVYNFGFAFTDFDISSANFKAVYAFTILPETEA